MDTRSTTEAREDFAELVNVVSYGKERVVLTRRGKAVAAVVPVEDLEVLEAAEDQADIEAARTARGEERVSWTQLKTELGL